MNMSKAMLFLNHIYMCFLTLTKVKLLLYIFMFAEEKSKKNYHMIKSNKINDHRTR